MVYVKMTLLDWICGRNRELTNKVTNPENPSEAGRVAQSLVRTNRWLRGNKTYRFPWYLTLALFQASINGSYEHSSFIKKYALLKNNVQFLENFNQVTNYHQSQLKFP